jgi:YfiH family protein
MSHPPSRLSNPLDALVGVRHGFFGRQGGVSQGVYASLNAGPGSKDDGAAVEENRRRIAAAIGAGQERLLSLYQIHSATALRVDAPWETRPEADAMVTTTPGLALTALAADCAPVLFAEPAARVIGAAHAGWKGALGGVLEAAVAEMERAGADRKRIVAAIGPCIGRASYEVGPEFRDRFLAADAHNEDFFFPGAGDRLQFDLGEYCAARLARLGLGAIDIVAADTCALEEEFFSNRRAVKKDEADFGRNCAVIMLEQPVEEEGGFGAL